MTEALTDMNALSKKLNEMETTVAKKTLTKAVREAAKPVQRAIKMAAPVSDRPQTKTVLSHKGNPKFPGFLKRSVTRASRFRRGFAMIDIGVKSEAFYGVSFVDRGTCVKLRRKVTQYLH